MEADKVESSEVKIALKNPCDFIVSKDDKIDILEQIPIKVGSQCNIYLGGISSLTEQELKKHKITSVLTIMTEKEKRKGKLEEKIEWLDDIQRHNQFMCDNDTPIGPYFIPAINFIIDSFNYNMNVLVHCKDGNSRSAALVAAFLIYKYKISTEKAIKAVQARRTQVSLTEDLTSQLQNYQQKLHQFKHACEK